MERKVILLSRTYVITDGDLSILDIFDFTEYTPKGDGVQLNTAIPKTIPYGERGKFPKKSDVHGQVHDGMHVRYPLS